MTDNWAINGYYPTTERPIGWSGLGQTQRPIGWAGAQGIYALVGGRESPIEPRQLLELAKSELKVKLGKFSWFRGVGISTDNPPVLKVNIVKNNKEATLVIPQFIRGIPVKIQVTGGIFARWFSL